MIRRKGDALYVKWKVYYSSLNSSIDKKDIVKMSEYFPEPKYLGGRVKVELSLPNYTTKVDFKNATGVDQSRFAKKVDLANFKPDEYKLYIDRLKNVPANLSNLK